MKELLERLQADFDEAEGWIRIVDADWLADDLRLTLSIQFQDGQEPELWELACAGVVEESLCSDGTEMLTVSDSPLLKAYVEPQTDIMFYENSIEPAFLLGVVFSSCIEIIGRPEFIPRFMNMSPTVNGIANSAYGLLGRFPESVATRILAALKNQPIKANALPGRMPKRWNGSEYVSYPALKVLEIGRSYVIGVQFSARRLAPPACKLPEYL